MKAPNKRKPDSREARMAKKNNETISKMLRLAERIGELEELLSAEDDEQKFDEIFDAITDLEEAFAERFGETLATWVRQGYEQGIQRLLKGAETAETLTFLESVLSHTSDEFVIGVDDKLYSYSLFAIPVAGVMDNSPRLSADTLDFLTKSLRRAGLVGPDPSVLLFPSAVELSDRTYSWCERYRLMSKVVAAFSQGDFKAVDACQSDRFFNIPNPDSENPEEPTMRLRLFVGVIASDVSDEFQEVFIGNDADQGNWIDEISALLSMELGNVMVSDPRLFSEALREGITLNNMLRLGLTVEQAKEQHQLKTIAVHWDPEMLGVELRLLDDSGDIVCSVNWDMMPADTDEVIDEQMARILSFAEQEELELFADSDLPPPGQIH